MTKRSQGAGSITPGVFLLVITLVALGTVMALGPGGITGFMHSIVDDASMLSISILATAMGLAFILLHRIGLSLGYVEEIALTEM